MDAETLTLPSVSDDPPRQPVPVLAAIVPLAGGVVLWLITGSVFSLCFAALGPLMIGASLLDAVRTRRKARRTAAAEEADQWLRVEQELRHRHHRERSELRRDNPDAAASVQERPLRDVGPVDDTTPIVIGSGTRRSALRVSGNDSERARSFRERAARVSDAPITVPMGRGICVRGPAPVVAAAVRAIIVQLCLRHAPSQLAICGEGLESLGLSGFAHAGRPRRGAWRVGVEIGRTEDLDAPTRIHLCRAGGEVPEGITTVIDVTEPSHARLRTGAATEDIAVECLSRPQTAVIAASSADREGEAAQLPERVALGELVVADAGSAVLNATVGRTESAEVVLDLVEDGPHAIVTGVTGSGKSELLVTWIVAMALAHSPEEVAFVLADFKGGTAFDPLRQLPHVAAVMTDLDEEGARRGVLSLTAELRRREAVLAALGARSIAGTQGRLGRLIIVVDEFAALVQEHPDLAVVFTDIAARGRALGMHLILGTQRAAGVIRDALAANCPLRVSLRVTDAADSRLVIGSDHAAELPGGAQSRGLAFVRRPQDSEAVAVRVALTEPGDLRRAGAQWPDAVPPESPWLPPLPRTLPREEVPVREGEIVLGLGDEPARQRQVPVVLRPGEDRGVAVIGGTGSGRTSVLRALAAQSERCVVIPDDPEQAWDTVMALADARVPAPELILCDDVDQLVAALPVDHGQVLLERLERLVRSAGMRRCTVVVATGRITGQIARVIEALPIRMLLRMGTKMEHLAAGGESEGFLRDRPPGRARIDDRELQVVWVEAAGTSNGPQSGPDSWNPGAPVVGVVASGTRHVMDALRADHPGCEVLPVDEFAADLLGVRESRLDAPGTLIVVGDADGWQRQWSLWQRIRSNGEMLILAGSTAELRSLAGVRDLPPYAHSHRGRAWSIVEGHQPRRVVIPGLDPQWRQFPLSDQV